MNLTYLLRLSQVAEYELLPPVWKALVDASKRQHLMTLHKYFDNMAQWMSIRDPIVTTLGLFNMTLVLIFRLNHR